MKSAKKKNMSKIAMRVKQNLKADVEAARDDDPPSILKALISSLVECIADMNEPPDRGDQVQQLFNKASAKYQGDCSLFEMCCYLIFKVDAWHAQTGKESLRSDIFYRIIVPQMMTLFQTVFQKVDLHSVLNNRLEIYGELVRTDIDKIPIVFSQLMLRSSVSKRPMVHNDMNGAFPLIIAGIIDKLALTIRFNAFNKIMLPICVQSISFYYDKLEENDQLRPL